MGAILNFIKCIALIQLLGDNENYEVVGDSNSIGGKINLNDTLAAVIAILIIVLVSLFCVIWLIIKRRRYIKIVETALDEKKNAEAENNVQQNKTAQNSQVGVAQQNGINVKPQDGAMPKVNSTSQDGQVNYLNQPVAQNIGQAQVGAMVENTNITPVNYGVNGNNASNVNQNVESNVAQGSTPNIIVDHTGLTNNQNNTTPIAQVQNQNATSNNQLENQVATNTFNQITNQNEATSIEQTANQNILNSIEQVSNSNGLNGVQTENSASIQQNQGGALQWNSQQSSDVSETIQSNQPIENLNTGSSYQGQIIVTNNTTGEGNVEKYQQGVSQINGTNGNTNINNENTYLNTNQPSSDNSGGAINNKPKASWPGKV